MLLQWIVATIRHSTTITNIHALLILCPPDTTATICLWLCLWRHLRLGKCRIGGIYGILRQKNYIGNTTLQGCRAQINLLWRHAEMEGVACIRRLGHWRVTRCTLISSTHYWYDTHYTFSWFQAGYKNINWNSIIVISSKLLRKWMFTLKFTFLITASVKNTEFHLVNEFICL